MEESQYHPQPGASQVTLTELKRKTSRVRRMRPPDMLLTDEGQQRIPLRAPDSHPMLHKRESKLGFRNIFGRSKGVKEIDITRSESVASSPRPQQQTIKLDAFPSRPKSQGANEALRPPSSSQQRSNPRPRATLQRKASADLKGQYAGLAKDIPSLFQAYPQAVRHARLPAYNQAEHLLKAHGKKDIQASEAPQNEPTWKAKTGRSWRDSVLGSSWTIKTYVLMASGYLLQYAAEGDFDRYPEKMLRLTRYSKAYATDLIPGRHWVVHVSTPVATNNAVAQDTRSRFGLAPFRNAEKRSLSDLLMVFEDADEMKNWIVLLKSFITDCSSEATTPDLAGSRETVKATDLKSRDSQRTVVPRSHGQIHDQVRYEPVQEQQAHASTNSMSHPHGPHRERNASLGDESSSSSYVSSHNGRQLDALRGDSSHRHSYMSVDQGTHGTSDSSPTCSPVRGSFASQTSINEGISPHTEGIPPSRTRSNSTIRHERKDSTQSTTSSLNHSPTSRRGSERRPTGDAPTPNFSLPHTVNRRRSSITPDPNQIHGSAPSDLANNHRAVAPRRVRRPPPPSLGASRPLSIVADTPSPSRASPRHDSRDPDAILSQWAGPNVMPPPPPPQHHQHHQHQIQEQQQRQQQHGPHASHAPHLSSSHHRDDAQFAHGRHAHGSHLNATIQTATVVRISPRKHASTSALRPAKTVWADLPPPPPGPPRFKLGPAVPNRFSSLEHARPPPYALVDRPARSSSSMGFRQVSSSSLLVSGGHGGDLASHKRASMVDRTAPLGRMDTHISAAMRPGSSQYFVPSLAGESISASLSTPSAVAVAVAEAATSSPMPQPINHSFHRRRSSASVQIHDSSSLHRRSTSHPVEELPPRAPPPTRALPPVPVGHGKKRSESSVSVLRVGAVESVA